MSKYVKYTTLITILIFSFLFVQTQFVSAQANSFPDVDPTTPTGKAITKLAKLGIVSGKPDGTYGTKDPVTRASAAKIIYGVLELENFSYPFTEERFHDVSLFKRKHWAFDEIMMLADYKIMVGINETTFKPSAPLTRAAMSKILYTALNLPDGPKTLPFKDLNKNAYYYKAVSSLYANGITEGVSKTKFAPNAAITRGQLAVFLDRSGILDELLGDTEEDTVDLTKLKQVDNQFISKAKFDELYTYFAAEIESIDAFSYKTAAHFNTQSKEFEQLDIGETIFDVQFKSLETPIYLKIQVDSNSQPKFKFILPETLKSIALSMSGTVQLQQFFKDQMTLIDFDHFDSLYTYVAFDPFNSFYKYYVYLGDGIYYFEFDDSMIPSIINYEFIEMFGGEITIHPYEMNGVFDFTIEII